MNVNLNNKYDDINELITYFNIIYKILNKYDVEFKIENDEKIIVENYIKYENEFDDDVVYLISNNFNIIEIIEKNNNVEIIIKKE